LVLAIAFALLALSVGVMAVLLSTAHTTGRTISHLVTSVEPPKDHLLAAERDNDSGQRALGAAVVATGAERTRLLSLAIDYSQKTSSEWTKYKAAAVGLRGEKALAAKYEADQARASKVSSDALVPIVNSTGIGALPPAEIDAYATDSNDLIRLHTMYRQADRNILNDLGARTRRFELLLMVGGSVGFCLLLVGTIASLRIARRTMTERAGQREVARLSAFETRLRRALELVDTGTAAFAIAERAIREAVPDAHAT